MLCNNPQRLPLPVATLCAKSSQKQAMQAVNKHNTKVCPMCTNVLMCCYHFSHHPSTHTVTRKLFSSTARRVGVQQPTHTVVHSRFMVTSAGVMGLAVLMSQEAGECQRGVVVV